MYTFAGITDVFARLIIKVSQLTHAQVMTFSLQYFDENGNGILDGQETVNWNKAVEQAVEQASNFGPESFHSEVMAALKRAHADSEMDDDFKTGTETELVQFGLRLWNEFVKIFKKYKLYNE